MLIYYSRKIVEVSFAASRRETNVLLPWHRWRKLFITLNYMTGEKKLFEKILRFS